MPDAIKEMANQRAKVCLGSGEGGTPCEHMKPSTFIRWIELVAGGIAQKEKKETDGFKCNACGCGFNQKLLSPEASCPIQKW